MRLFHRMKDKVLNRLSRAQYDQEATWSTRTWLALQTQRMSIAVHFAVLDSLTSPGRRTQRRFGVARCKCALECTRAFTGVRSRACPAPCSVRYFVAVPWCSVVPLSAF